MATERRRAFASPHLARRRQRGGAAVRAWLALASIAGVPATGWTQAPAAGERDWTPTVHASWTQFFGSAVRGDADDDLKVGGKITAALVFQGEPLRLWRGFTINVGTEFVFGSSVNQSGAGAVLPLNAAMMFPGSGREDVDLSVNFTQRIGRSSLTFGKINMLDTVARTPLVGGAGLEGFQHVALATPPSELTPPTILGALWSRPFTRASVTVGVWDVTSALNRTGLSSPFSEGVAGMTSVVFPIRLGGRRGFHGFTVMGTTKRGLNLEDVGDVLLPPESEVILGEKRGGWHVKYFGQQYLWEDPDVPGRGWGVFGHVGTWDANPTPMQWSMTAGVTGSPPLDARPQDRFGLGYFRSSFSRTLRDGLAPIVQLGDEHGAEAFYTFEVIPRVRITGALQLVDSSIAGVDDTVVLAVRTRVAF